MRIIGKTLIVVSSILLAAAVTNAQIPASRPGGNAASDAAANDKGKEVFGVVCSGCHTATHASIQRKTINGWRKTVYTMIGRGAQVLPDEIEPLAAYLTSAYGPNSPAPVLRGAAGGTPQALAPGSDVVIRSCGGCHAVNLIFDSRKTLAGWRDTIKYMRSNGAKVSDADMETVAAYLAEHYGPR